MDEYLRCLFNYIQENRSGALLKTVEYQTRHMAMCHAWNAIEDALSPNQLKIVDEFLSQHCRVAACETEWLFLEAVALGKWLAQA